MVPVNAIITYTVRRGMTDMTEQMTGDAIRNRLTAMSDTKFREFQKSLIPTVSGGSILGVRTPELRGYARELYGSGEYVKFIHDLPHRYFEENQLHAFIISLMKDYGPCISELEKFLPFVDNWATCDQLSPKVFKKHRAELLDHIKVWIASGKTYIVRFGIGMLMEHYLDEAFDPSYPELVARIKSEEYYVNMMRAWYFATALAKQYETAVRYIKEHRLDPWTHNRTIQKAVESFRVNDERKAYLKTLKMTK